MTEQADNRKSAASSMDASTVVGSDELPPKEKPEDVFVEIEVSRNDTINSASLQDQSGADACPDGGIRAWLCVLGVSPLLRRQLIKILTVVYLQAATGLFSVTGLIASWGVRVFSFGETHILIHE